METMPVQGDLMPKIIGALKRSTLFSGQDDGLLTQMVAQCELLKVGAREVIVREGEPSDAFFLVLSGQASVLIRHKVTGEQTPVSLLGANDGIGEMGLLRGEPRSASVVATAPCLLLKLDKRLFDDLFDRTAGFARAVCRSLADRLAQTGRAGGVPYDLSSAPPDPETVAMLPMEFIQRHRVSPVKKEGVVAQNLCKRIGGGRCGAYEVLVCTSAIANLIREGKTHQVLSIMQTGKNLGNTLLNDELARLVTEGKVEFKEAIRCSPDKRDLARKLNREYQEE